MNYDILIKKHKIIDYHKIPIPRGRLQNYFKKVHSFKQLRKYTITRGYFTLLNCFCCVFVQGSVSSTYNNSNFTPLLLNFYPFTIPLFLPYYPLLFTHMTYHLPLYTPLSSYLLPLYLTIFLPIYCSTFQLFIHQFLFTFDFLSN